MNSYTTTELSASFIQLLANFAQEFCQNDIIYNNIAISIHIE